MTRGTFQIYMVTAEGCAREERTGYLTPHKWFGVHKEDLRHQRRRRVNGIPAWEWRITHLPSGLTAHRQRTHPAWGCRALCRIATLLEERALDQGIDLLTLDEDPQKKRALWDLLQDAYNAEEAGSGK